MTKPAPGFNQRLLTAMATKGLNTPDQLATAVGITRAKAYRLLSNDPPVIEALLIIRIIDLFNFAGRWLLTGIGSPTPRRAIDPDDAWLLDTYHDMSCVDRDALAVAIKQLKAKQ